jgi:hypothetical protein
MALGKLCPCGKENAGRNSHLGRNCRRLFKKWGEQRDLSDVIAREEDLARWKAPVDARLHKDRSRVVVLRRKREAA